MKMIEVERCEKCPKYLLHKRWNWVENCNHPAHPGNLEGGNSAEIDTEKNAIDPGCPLPDNGE